MVWPVHDRKSLFNRDFVYVTITMKHNGSVIAINKIRRSFDKLFFNDYHVPSPVANMHA